LPALSAADLLGEKRMGIFILASPIYATLIWYAIWSWRQLQPGIPLAALIRTLVPGIIGFSVIWLLLSLCLAGITAVLYTGVTDNQQLSLLYLVTFVPFLPYVPAALLADFLALLGLPHESSINMGIFILSAIASAPLLLLLISFIEVGILRLAHRAKAEGNNGL
jgi:hypothetical protein